MSFGGGFAGARVRANQSVAAQVQAYTVYNGLDPLSGGSQVDCGQDASLANMPSSDFTIDLYIRATTDRGYFGSSLFTKDDGGWDDGWAIFIDMYNGYASDVWGFVGRASSEATFFGTEILTDDTWVHLVIEWDVSEYTFYAAVDGAWKSVGPNTGSGDLGLDSDTDLRWGVDWYESFGNPSPECDIAWVRFSNMLRWPTGVGFTPEGETPPSQDGDTLEIWALNEGSGSTAAATINAGNDGTLTNVTWETF